MRSLVACLSAATLLSACTAKTYTDGENYRGDTQSTYDVWDYEIVSAHDLAGKRFRIAVVNERHFSEPNLEVEGNDGLDDSVRKSIPVGSSKRVVVNDTTLRSIYTNERIELRRLEKSDGVVANITHVRSCPVTTTSREHTKIIGDSSKGIITIPKLVTVVLREYTKPPCEHPSDRLDKLAAPVASTTPSAEVIAAIKKSAEEDVEKEFQRKLSDRIQQIEREFEKTARSIPFEPKTKIEQAFCPRLAGMMRAAGIAEIQLERHEISKVEGKGYTEIRYQSTATLLPMNVKFDDGDLSGAATLFRSIKPDARGCVDTTPVSEQSGSSEDELKKIAKELETIIHRHQNGVNYARAMKELGH